MKAIDYDIASIKKAVTVDTSMYKITYSLKFKYSQNDKDYQTDTRIVQIGKHYVKDYSEILYHYDSLATVNFSKGRSTPSLPDPIFPYEILNNNIEKTCYIQYRTICRYTFCYHVPQMQQQWQLIPDTSMVILGHHCNMAKVNYAGRDYIAWYAIDIPIHYGPYKFAWLPGLIMKIEDINKKYIWTVTGFSNKSAPIKNNTYEESKETTLEKANAAIRKMFYDSLTFSNSTGMTVMTIEHGKLVPVKSCKPIPFEPIELE